ncbi:MULTISPECIES: hypothetical protein [unclassified Nocardioides]|uniref:hypothetical protein n=1 Tax=unclassified Nocardioides TaxID=2615069 RepID=UPI0009F0D41A|nr:MULTISPECIES: hypothetical protein [unclassified Nocardioides]GAW52153.1 hypothetical protein PD653B2_4503 [Nocardioides sp. PD653-B2]GAW57539.1 hypothetical protein PD653_4984 [Nocardioides sp. PD653]
MPILIQWNLDDLEPAASEMEARLLYPDGSSTAISPLLGSVVPAVLPRLSREELGLLGRLRGPLSPTVLPARAPGDQLVRQVRVRRHLLHFYLDRLPGLDRDQRRGIDAACDIATVLHLETWIAPDVRDETMRSLRQLIGPEEELAFGPAHVEVLDILGSISDVTGCAPQTDAVGRVWMDSPLRHWESLAAELVSAATLTNRMVSLRMVQRVTAVKSDVVRRSSVFRAARMCAAATILADVVDEGLVAAATYPWEVGLSAGPAAA